jgi:hypothetical protein
MEEVEEVLLNSMADLQLDPQSTRSSARRDILRKMPFRYCATCFKPCRNISALKKHLKETGHTVDVEAAKREMYETKEMLRDANANFAADNSTENRVQQKFAEATHHHSLKVVSLLIKFRANA